MDSAAADREILVELTGVSFRYGPNPALSGVDLTIRAGDFLAILGPNGSGKTTLLKVILGLLTPDAGEVRLLGRPAVRFTEWDRIGYVPQKATHIDPLLPVSVEEVVAMALCSHRSPACARRRDRTAAVREALRLVGMDKARRRPVGGLSGGQQQRVFIARALVTRPRILILDEPTTGVDQETKDGFFGLLDRLNRSEGITIVLVTHDIGIVDRHVNTVACLNQTLVYHGTHAEFCRSGVIREMLAGGHHLVSHDH